MLHQVVSLGETIIPLKNGAALVASKSTIGGWHVIRAGKCSCLGYQRRGQCRHLKAVQALQSAPPVELSQSTTPIEKRARAPEPEGDPNRPIRRIQETIGDTTSI